MFRLEGGVAENQTGPVFRLRGGVAENKQKLKALLDLCLGVGGRNTSGPAFGRGSRKQTEVGPALGQCSRAGGVRYR